MKKHGFAGLAVILLMIVCFTLPVYADIGPKPSLTIQCSGIEEKAYVTVLSTVKEYGPNSPKDELDFEIRAKEDPVWFENTGIDKEIYISFCKETERLNDAGEKLYFWGVVSPAEKDYLFGYWPPEEFRILIYLADSGRFILSEKTYTRTAFRTVLKCTYKDGSLSVMDISTAETNAGALAFRILLTIIAEYLVGLLFMKHDGRSRIAIVLVNLVTQLVLNFGLSMAVYAFGYGMAAYYAVLAVMEILIVIAEWKAYEKWIPAPQLKNPFVYSLLANCASFAAGVIMASMMPFFFR